MWPGVGAFRAISFPLHGLRLSLLLQSRHRRARNPEIGKLTIPGGFVDTGETAEDALRREITEEVGLRLGELAYLCSVPNQYHYQGVTYQVLDFFYTGRTDNSAITPDASEVTEICWLAPEEIPLGDLAFASVREAVGRYLSSPR